MAKSKCKTRNQYLKDGINQYNESEYEKSLKTFKEGLIIYPDDKTLLYYFAVACEEVGNPVRGKEILEKLHQQFPKNHRILFSLGECYLDLGQKIKALELFKHISQMQRENAKLLIDIAWLLGVHELYDEAERYRKLVKRTNPHYTETYKADVVQYFHSGQENKSLAALHKLIEIESNTPDKNLRLFIGESHIHLTKDEEGFAWLFSVSPEEQDNWFSVGEVIAFLKEHPTHPQYNELPRWEKRFAEVKKKSSPIDDFVQRLLENKDISGLS